MGPSSFTTVACLTNLLACAGGITPSGFLTGPAAAFAYAAACIFDSKGLLASLPGFAATVVAVAML